MSDNLKIYRISVKTGDSERIMLETFSEKAADDMQAHLQKEMPRGSVIIKAGLIMKTIHAETSTMVS